MGQFQESNVVRSKGAGTGGQFAEKHRSQGSDLPKEITSSGITAYPGVPAEIAAGIAQTGLTGSISPYQGNNPDYPDETFTYKNPESDYELDFYRNDDGGYTVSYEDRWNEDNSFTVQMDEYTPERLAGTLEDTLYDLDVAAAGQDAFRSVGDDFELRDTELVVDGEGNPHSSVLVSDEEGEWIHLNHDHGKGKTTLSSNSEYIEGEDADELLTRIVGDSENARGRAAAMFEQTLAGAAASPFAPQSLKPRIK